MDQNKVSFLEIHIEKRDKPILTVKDVIVLLFGVNPKIPIETRTAFYKELFLIYEEVLKKPEVSQYIYFSDPEFVPYVYGPFSFTVASDLGELLYINAIRKDGRKNDERFTITDAGMEIFGRLEDESLGKQPLDWLIPYIREKRRGWDQLGRSGLMARMRNYYPNYFLFGTKQPRKVLKLVLEHPADRTSDDNFRDAMLQLKNDIPIEELEEAKEKYLMYEEKYEGLMWAQLYRE